MSINKEIRKGNKYIFAEMSWAIVIDDVTAPKGGENRLVGKVKQQNRTYSAQYVFQQTIFNLSDIHLQQFYLN